MPITVGDIYLPLFQGYGPQIVLYEGRRGTGKTRAILSAIVARALRCPGSRWGLFRSRRTRLSETVLTTLEQQVLPAFGLAVPGGAGTENRHRYDLPNGSVLLPFGLDDPARTQSLELAGLYVAEVTEIPTLDEVVALVGSLRQAVQPSWPADFSHQAILDCNPSRPGHWANQTAEDVPNWMRMVNSRADYERLLRHARAPAPPGRWKRVITTHCDNPYYFDVVRWAWTKAGEAYLKTLGLLSGHLRKRWLEGLWVSESGTVYPEFEEDRHVVDPFPRGVPSSWPTFVFCDPGYDHVCAVVWWVVSPNGTFYVAHEVYQGGWSVEQHAANLHAQNAGFSVRDYYGDPRHMFKKTMESPESIAQQFKRHSNGFAGGGFNFRPWPRIQGEDVEPSVEAVRDLLRHDKLKVWRTCRNTINEFQSWSYKRTAKGELPPGDDAFEDRNNHALDCIRGAVALKLRHEPQLVTISRGKRRAGERPAA
jgi:hypothetical protein